jgi:hypothetical protein
VSSLGFIFCFTSFRDVSIRWLRTRIFRLAHFLSPWRYMDE